jgi:hypothetical protein
MVTLVSKERRNTSSGVRSIVIGELCDRKKASPVVLLIVAVDADILLESLIDSFRLSIAFRVVSGSEMEFHVQCLSE